MATRDVVPALSRSDLAERGLFAGARVADLRYPWPYRFGTVVDVPGPLLIGVRFDDGEWLQCPEWRIGALGLRVSDADLAALKYGRRAPSSAT